MTKRNELIDVQLDLITDFDEGKICWEIPSDEQFPLYIYDKKIVIKYLNGIMYANAYRYSSDNLLVGLAFNYWLSDYLKNEEEIIAQIEDDLLEIGLENELSNVATVVNAVHEHLKRAYVKIQKELNYKRLANLF